MAKHIDAEKLLEWIEENMSNEDDGFPNANYYYTQGVKQSLNAVKDKIEELSVEFDADGWCWDMAKCPENTKDEFLVLAYRSFTEKDKGYYRAHVSCISLCPSLTESYGENNYTGTLLGCEGLEEIQNIVAWRLLPAIPSKEKK